MGRWWGWEGSRAAPVDLSRFGRRADVRAGGVAVLAVAQASGSALVERSGLVRVHSIGKVVMVFGCLGG